MSRKEARISRKEGRKDAKEGRREGRKDVKEGRKDMRLYLPFQSDLLRCILRRGPGRKEDEGKEERK
jgi:hypothetical protein